MKLEGAVVLITGGTGSFGSHVAERLLRLGPAEIRVFSRDEKKQWEMRQRYPRFRYLLGDVRDPARLAQAMEGADHVFHAAALKQVPSCEESPYEAALTNVLGSHHACEAARAAGVKAFVALSTDKAVKAVNAMGMSKAMMEKIVCNQNRYGCPTRFSCVRYGNVMGSRGSVIPLFRRQIREDRPLTLTLPGMTRFLMTLDESIGLVLRALEQARGGEIFVRKSPACTMALLADAMRLRHSPRGMDHPLSPVGIRPGEKIHEILVNEYEMQRATAGEDHYVIHPEYRIPPIPDPPAPGAEYTSANTRQLASVEEVIERLGEMEAAGEHD